MLARQEEADLSDRPSTRASNDPPDYTAHIRSKSTAHAHSPKRLSVFSGRSRSNTSTSTSSSRRSPASSMTSADAASLPYSSEDRAISAGIRSDRHERHESMTKSLFSRGSRILRRQGSKFNIAATLDEEDEVGREKSRFEVSEIFSRHHKTRQSNARKSTPPPRVIFAREKETSN
jgi:RNA polymerase-associated protein CTR9